MNCTCSKNKYPCPIHGEQGLPVSEVVNHDCYVIRICRRRRMREDKHWAADGPWFSEITKDAMHAFTGSDRENKIDAMLEATCFLTSLQQKQPKEK
jgi:hypothetical protein